MEFSFTEEQEFFRQTVRDTIDRMIMPKVQELDESEEFSFELWHEFAKLGYLGIRHPEKYGGMDLDVISQMARRRSSRRCSYQP
jgi:alkylation response protein AidB-like acyl-CoA dehydrogenase